MSNNTLSNIPTVACFWATWIFLKSDWMKYRILNPKQQFGFQQLTTNKLILFNNSRSSYPNFYNSCFRQKMNRQFWRFSLVSGNNFEKKKSLENLYFCQKMRKRWFMTAREKRCTKKIWFCFKNVLLKPKEFDGKIGDRICLFCTDYFLRLD